MEQKTKDFIEFVKNEMPQNNKDKAEQATQQRFKLKKDRKVYYCNEFAVRFCYSKNTNFSNVVLSLSKLKKYDNIPFFVILVSGNRDNELYLANSTFLNKISHSSQQLREDNIKGSFLGSNIIKEYNGIHNDYRHVDELFNIHKNYTWKENLSRLVKVTSEIKAIKTKFNPNKEQIININSSIKRTKDFLLSDDYKKLKLDLDNKVQYQLKSIIEASHFDNVNIRGRLIEYIITSGDISILNKLKQAEDKLPFYDTKNGIGDYIKQFNKYKTYTDIKTKIMYLGSSPKAYNLDKFLKIMSEENSIFLFYFIGIDNKEQIKTTLCSVYDKRLIDGTTFQFHWAGRGTRGVAQFDGKAITSIINAQPFENNIDEEQCKDFINKMLNR